MLRKEKSHHNSKGESRAHSMHHKYDGHKMAAVVNHAHTERLHSNSPKLLEKKP